MTNIEVDALVAADRLLETEGMKEVADWIRIHEDEVLAYMYAKKFAKDSERVTVIRSFEQHTVIVVFLDTFDENGQRFSGGAALDIDYWRTWDRDVEGRPDPPPVFEELMGRVVEYARSEMSPSSLYSRTPVTAIDYME